MIRAIILFLLAIASFWIGCYYLSFYPVGTWQQGPISFTMWVAMSFFSIGALKALLWPPRVSYDIEYLYYL